MNFRLSDRVLLVHFLCSAFAEICLGQGKPLGMIGKAGLDAMMANKDISPLYETLTLPPMTYSMKDFCSSLPDVESTEIMSGMPYLYFIEKHEGKLAIARYEKERNLLRRSAEVNIDTNLRLLDEYARSFISTLYQQVIAKWPPELVLSGNIYFQIELIFRQYDPKVDFVELHVDNVMTMAKLPYMSRVFARLA